MTKNKNRVYEKTYEKYFNEVKRLNWPHIARLLGLEMVKDALEVPLFDNRYTLTQQGLKGEDGKRPHIAICVALLRYLLLCPEGVLFPRPDVWKAYRDFKDAGPLIVYFANDCEMPITRTFTGRIGELEAACDRIGGEKAPLDLPYQLAYVVKAFPTLSLLILFNDGDEEFPAACSLLYSEHADRYLDAECLAILANLLACRLIDIADEKGGKP